MYKARIRDVAQLAGVSTATVSHVINKTRFVSKETTDKVLSAIRQLDYTPNITAIGLRTGQTKTIGLIVPDISNAFFSDIIESIEYTLSKYNYHLIIANTNETVSREVEHLQYFSSGVVDGVIIASTIDNFDTISKSIKPNIPLVFIDRKPLNLSKDCILISNGQAIFDAVGNLINSGHSKIGFINGLPRLSSSKDRLNAYRSAISSHGLSINEEFIVNGNSLRNSAHKCVDKLIAAGCDSMIVGNGLMTLEAIDYIKESYVSTGKDIKVIGFSDGYSMSSTSCIIQPVHDLGERAAKQIISRIASPASKICEIVLNGSFKCQ